jgi:ribose 5-phosphate isomerase B
MKIALGSDHRGFETKRRLLAVLKSAQYDVVDVGTTSEESCDYPDFAFDAAKLVGSGQVDRAVLVCGTGIGMCICANKVPGARAALCHDSITAEMSRRHNDANILCLSADLLGEELMERMVKLWLATEFEGGRHSRRVEKIAKFEQQNCGGKP